ncbi:AbrB/MazE/SpoVT family DNA-binding domain-containing protein [Paenibacillus sp. FSL L8-0470]|uniref:AbrB/MazE/SpoVT family DNA-binding domain-containing protein n=1 Tax=Paenibacillus sp. FSL L8-0470 TaxID=2954688 RepID=UPI0030F52746
MKATGIVRQLDGLGRVVLPKSLRHTLNIAEGDGLEIFVEGEKIILRKYTPGCCLCGNVERELVSLYPEKLVCKPCIKLIVREEKKLVDGFASSH